MIDTRLKDKVALITGVNNPLGVGAATAMAFAKEGTRVLGTYLPLPLKSSSTKEYSVEFYEAQISQTPDEVIGAVRKLGGKIEVIPIDLSGHEAIPSLFDQAERLLGPVDILVNNAAHGIPDTFAPERERVGMAKTVWDYPTVCITAESVDKHFAVNCRAVALMMAEFARRIASRATNWGRIVNVSTDGASGFATEVSYGASKHAMESYSRAAAKELGKYGITVNVVSLGAIQTGWIGAQLGERVAAETPLGRVGKPTDVADVIVFLASEQARWLTGQTLYVGGGHLMPL